MESYDFVCLEFNGEKYIKMSEMEQIKADILDAAWMALDVGDYENLYALRDYIIDKEKYSYEKPQNQTDENPVMGSNL